MELRPKLNFFLEYGHFAYQIKAGDAGSNMVETIWPTDTSSSQGMGSKGKLYLFLEVVMLRIKLKLTRVAATW